VRGGSCLRRRRNRWIKGEECNWVFGSAASLRRFVAIAWKVSIGALFFFLEDLVRIILAVVVLPSPFSLHAWAAWGWSFGALVCGKVEGTWPRLELG
jgi:hypothetical protein